MINRPNFMGLDGFAWWFGIVENRIDPLTLGRCQVRIFGWHTENKTQIPTKDLPWAHPILPISSNSSTITFAKEGDMVFGFFLDSDDAQFPVMMGIVPGISEFTPRIDKGFSDPRDSTALSQAPKVTSKKTYSSDGGGVDWTDVDQPRFPSMSGEPTISRLARNENIENTIIGERKSTRVKNVLTSTQGNWSEPETQYKTKYPYNHVYESESGHVMEFDDTPGAERVHIAHRSGTFDEIFPDGTKVTKITRDKYEIIMSDESVYIMGACQVTINGQSSVFIRGNADLKVGGNMKTSIKGTYEVVSTGNMKFVAPKIDLNPPGEVPTYIEQTYTPENAVIERRQVPGASGTFIFGGVEMNANTESYVGVVPGIMPDGKVDGPKDVPDANVPPSPPVNCGDFSEPLKEEDYKKKLSTNYTLASLTIIPNAKYRITSQSIKGVRLTESEIACNLQALAENVLEPLRSKYPGFNINSGFRIGSDQSQHGTGEAADLQWIGKDRQFLLEVCTWARDNLNYDQIVYEVPEPGSGNPYTQHAWMHISYSRGVGPYKGNRTKSNITKNITYRGYGDRYYKQYEINWDKIQFAKDSSGVLRPLLGSGVEGMRVV